MYPSLLEKETKHTVLTNNLNLDTQINTKCSFRLDTEALTHTGCISLTNIGLCRVLNTNLIHSNDRLSMMKIFLIYCMKQQRKIICQLQWNHIPTEMHCISLAFNELPLLKVRSVQSFYIRRQIQVCACGICSIFNTRVARLSGDIVKLILKEQILSTHPYLSLALHQFGSAISRMVYSSSFFSSRSCGVMGR